MDCDRKLTVCGTKVLLAERIIPTGIMARYQVTLDIEDLYRTGIFIALPIQWLDLFVRLIPAGVFRGWWAVPTLQILAGFVNQAGAVSSPV